MDSTALLKHIVSQTRQNIDFLVSQHQISAPDAQAIIAKLPTISDSDVSSLTKSTENLLLRSAPPPPSTSPSETTRPVLARGRAIWGYNEDRSDPNDLSFSPGDVIDIVAETNADWWTGRNKGSEGLFPANYVERLPAEKHIPEKVPTPSYHQPQTYTPPQSYNPPPFPPSGGPPMAYSPSYPPGPPRQYQPYQPPPQQYQPYSPPPQPQPVQQPSPADPKPAGKFDGLGNTLAHSAAGGVGFGAGSAVGSGLINAIF